MDFRLFCAWFPTPFPFQNFTQRVISLQLTKFKIVPNLIDFQLSLFLLSVMSR